jgi:hypothetical protein
MSWVAYLAEVPVVAVASGGELHTTRQLKTLYSYTRPESMHRGFRLVTQNRLGYVDLAHRSYVERLPAVRWPHRCCQAALHLLHVLGLAHAD